MTEVMRNGERGVKRKEDTEGENHCGDGRERVCVIDLRKEETRERKEDWRAQIEGSGKNKKRRNRKEEGIRKEKKVKNMGKG